MDPRTEPSSEPLSGGEDGRSATSEAKRLAARRRFMRGATTGTGIVIVTLFHRRAAAVEQQRQMVGSSAAVCASLTGHQPSGRMTEVNSVPGDTSTPVVRRYVCD